MLTAGSAVRLVFVNHSREKTIAALRMAARRAAFELEVSRLPLHLALDEATMRSHAKDKLAPMLRVRAEYVEAAESAALGGPGGVLGLDDETWTPLE